MFLYKSTHLSFLLIFFFKSTEFMACFMVFMVLFMVFKISFEITYNYTFFSGQLDIQ